MKTQHTPGPWECGQHTGKPKDKNLGLGWYVNAKDNGSTRVADCYGYPHASHNARLISSAPDMLRIMTVLGDYAAIGGRLPNCSALMPDSDETIGSAIRDVLAKINGPAFNCGSAAGSKA